MITRDARRISAGGLGEVLANCCVRPTHTFR